MSIIANFINNIQDLTYSNVILSLNNQVNSLKETLSKQENTITSLRKALNYQKRKNK